MSSSSTMHPINAEATTKSEATTEAESTTKSTQPQDEDIFTNMILDPHLAKRRTYQQRKEMKKKLQKQMEESYLKHGRFIEKYPIPFRDFEAERRDQLARSRRSKSPEPALNPLSRYLPPNAVVGESQSDLPVMFREHRIKDQVVEVPVFEKDTIVSYNARLAETMVAETTAVRLRNVSVNMGTGGRKRKFDTTGFNEEWIAATRTLDGAHHLIGKLIARKRVLDERVRLLEEEVRYLKN